MPDNWLEPPEWLKNIIYQGMLWAQQETERRVYGRQPKPSTATSYTPRAAVNQPSIPKFISGVAVSFPNITKDQYIAKISDAIAEKMGAEGIDDEKEAKNLIADALARVNSEGVHEGLPFYESVIRNYMSPQDIARWDTAVKKEQGEQQDIEYQKQFEGSKLSETEVTKAQLRSQILDEYTPIDPVKLLQAVKNQVVTPEEAYGAKSKWSKMQKIQADADNLERTQGALPEESEGAASIRYGQQMLAGYNQNQANLRRSKMLMQQMPDWVSKLPGMGNISAATGNVGDVGGDPTGGGVFQQGGGIGGYVSPEDIRATQFMGLMKSPAFKEAMLAKESEQFSEYPSLYPGWLQYQEDYVSGRDTGLATTPQTFNEWIQATPYGRATYEQKKRPIPVRAPRWAV